MKYWSPKNFRVYTGVNFKDPNNWFHFFISFLGAVLGHPIKTYSLGLAWEVWNWGNPSYKLASVTDSWLKRNFCYSEGFSLEDATIFDGGGVGLGIFVRGLLIEFGAI